MDEQEFYIGQVFAGDYPEGAAKWCSENNATIEETTPEGSEFRQFAIVAIPEPEITPADYDRAMEDHIKAARVARGYTTREPSEYNDSSVPRWAQDAVDYIAFRDACMLYGLAVMNAYADGEEVPTLEQFKENLPVCVWTYTGEE